ncbi:hypothetical protein GQX71_00890 [Wolbachia endosymbiont of Drosophila melanogaster]|nr:WPE palindromic element domain-containing protein [Wolbachia endosymbiont of Drosophila melanogaster]QEC81711.1 hypothetical protein FRT62_00900 [Wolbachia pipientis]MCE4149367.1 hypothetical protein [Wolbachia endosymbiont of Drosophila melanogaster]QED00569.1 hypothetical protein FRT63_00895 [Wolbachia pipientis]QED01699.1 hypothetical protein FRT61_00900 [Wolbachia pipientis]QQL96778.1 hypothetical protein GQX71_00890 [Wolbachia endosymbiont of Drosophila melanogaster]
MCTIATFLIKNWIPVSSTGMTPFRW